MSWLVEMLTEMILEVLFGLAGHWLGERLPRPRPVAETIVGQISEGRW